LPEASGDQICRGDACIARAPPPGRDALQDLARTKHLKVVNKRKEGDLSVALFPLMSNVEAGSD
jgi:hypothetical protein